MARRRSPTPTPLAQALAPVGRTDREWAALLGCSQSQLNRCLTGAAQTGHLRLVLALLALAVQRDGPAAADAVLAAAKRLLGEVGHDDAG